MIGTSTRRTSTRDPVVGGNRDGDGGEWTREPPDRTGAIPSRLRRRAPAIPGSADRRQTAPDPRPTRRSGECGRRRMRVAPRKARPFVPGDDGPFLDSRPGPDRRTAAGGDRTMTTTDPLSLTAADGSPPRPTRSSCGRPATPISRRRSAPSCGSTTAGPAYLLESVEGGERLGRYSFLGVGPRRLLEVRDGVAEIQTRPLSVDAYRPDLPIERESVADPLAALRSFVARRRVLPLEGMPRFTGGAVGALAYDAVSIFEPTVPLPEADPVGVPTAGFIETDLVLVFDHLTHTMSAIASLHTTHPTSRAATPSPSGRSSRRSSEPPGRVRRSWPVGAAGRRAGGPARSPGRPERGRDQPRARRLYPRGRGRQGGDRGRRGDPGRAGPAPVVRAAIRRRRPRHRRHRAVPLAPPGQPEPVPVLRPDARRSRSSARARSSSSRSRATG